MLLALFYGLTIVWVVGTLSAPDPAWPRGGFWVALAVGCFLFPPAGVTITVVFCLKMRRRMRAAGA
ncbi:MAG TPA: hypothetical protein VIC35_07910 [Acidimicrobiia bacterium]